MKLSKSRTVVLGVVLYATGSLICYGQQVDTPALSLSSGDYVLEQSLRVECGTADASVHYTITEPGAEIVVPTTAHSAVPAGGTILVDRSLEITVRAFKSGLEPSEVTGAGYRITGMTAAGGNHTAALTSNGEVWGWGSNTNGELGDGTSGTAARPAPTRVKSDASNYLSNVKAVAAGTSHTVALRADGTVAAWGLNS